MISKAAVNRDFPKCSLLFSVKRVKLIERLSMTLTANGRRQKLNFLASVLSRLYDKVKIFSFIVNKRFFPIFLLD